MADTLARHRKEQRELQARITQKKKNATKKTRKGINEECDILERDLKERHQAELDAIRGETITGQTGEPSVEDGDESTPVIVEQEQDGRLRHQEQEEVNGESTTGPPTPSKKPSRQKARLARRAAEQEALAADAEAEAANVPDKRAQEMAAMQEHMEKLGLKEISIRPDGHCLYSAVATGLPHRQVTDSGPYSIAYQNVRFKTADFISTHPDDFTAFLEEPLDTYVTKIKDTAEWGGQVELQAIARAYRVDIHVLQADGRVEKVESGRPVHPPVWLAYYRHSFGLGEHYNALTKESESER